MCIAALGEPSPKADEQNAQPTESPKGSSDLANSPYAKGSESSTKSPTLDPKASNQELVTEPQKNSSKPEKETADKRNTKNVSSGVKDGRNNTEGTEQVEGTPGAGKTNSTGLDAGKEIT